MSAARTMPAAVPIFTMGALSGLLLHAYLLGNVAGGLLAGLAALPLLIIASAYGGKAALLAGIAGWGAGGLVLALGSGAENIPDAVFLNREGFAYGIRLVLPAVLLGWLAQGYRAGQPVAHYWQRMPLNALAYTLYGITLLNLGLMSGESALLADIAASIQQLEQHNGIVLFENTAQQQQFLLLVPGIMACSWLLQVMLLAFAAQALAARLWGKTQKLLPSFHEWVFARRHGVFIVAAAVIAAVAEVPPASATMTISLYGVAANLAIAGVAIFLLQGLAVLHTIARLRQFRWLLWVFYGLMLVNPFPLALAVLLGLGDNSFGLRRYFQEENKS